MSVSFWVRKRSTWVWSSWEVSTSFCSCSVIWSCWVFELGQLLAEGGPAGERLAGQVLVALRQRRLGLVLQLVGLLLQPLGLQLDPLAGRGHVGHAPPDLLQLLELLLVGEVQGVAGVLHLVQDLVRLGPEDVEESAERACHGLPSIRPSGGAGGTGRALRRPAAKVTPCPIASACSPSTRTPTTRPPRAPPTVARYHAEGVRTVLVCCTGGEEGDILNPAMDTPEVRADIGRIRMAELKAATDIIGYDETVLLGYRDSGMPDSRGQHATRTASPRRRSTRRSAAWSPSSAGSAPR